MLRDLRSRASLLLDTELLRRETEKIKTELVGEDGTALEDLGLREGHSIDTVRAEESGQH